MGKNLLNIFIIVFIMAFHCCQKNVIENSTSIRDAEDIIYTENNDKPLSSTFELKFSQDLSLFEDDWWPLSLLIDEPGNIYVRTSPGRGLRKFSPSGNEIDRKEFPKGQAPGEFNGFDPCLSKNGNLYIADWSQRRLTTLDASFKILELSKLKLYGFIFRLDSRNNMYFLSVELLPNTTSRQKLVFTKCSPSGDPVLRIHEYEWGQYQDNNGIYHSDAFRTQLRYKIDSKDNAYYAATNKYEINVISPDEKIIKRITKKGKSRKLTQNEINSFEPEKPNSRSVTDIPENMPYIADLFLLENDFLLVVTFESGEDDDYLLGDIFNDAGIYEAQVKVPKYYRWNYLIAPSKRGAILKNNCFYTIESDENEELFWVKRYKVAWNY